MKKEVSISEFNVFHQRPSREVIISKYPDKPLIVIHPTLVSISHPAQEKLFCTKVDKILFSKRGESYYAGIQSIDSTMKGYAVYAMTNSKSLYIHGKRLVLRGLEPGNYLVGEPVFSGGIDWFELELFIE